MPCPTSFIRHIHPVHLLLATALVILFSPGSEAQVLPTDLAVLGAGSGSTPAGSHAADSARPQLNGGPTGLRPVGPVPPTPEPPTGDGLPDTILESDQLASGAFLAPLMGASVSSAGDVNGDGFEDVIVGAPGWDAPGGLFDEGAAFVFLGSPGGLIGSNPASAHAVIQSNDAAARFGSSVASAGDVNGDGYDDILVGAPLHDASGLAGSGAVYVFHGGPAGITASSPADADATMESKQIEAHLGASVAGAGDVNGDGFDDVIVGATLFGQPFNPPIPDQGSGRQGAAFVFLGGPLGVVGTDPSSAHARLVSWSAGAPPQVNARFGYSVSTAGDVNADGFADVLVGCPSWNQALSWPGVPGGDPPEEGAAFVFLGGPAGIVGDNPTNAHARIESGQLEGFMGHDVASAGDVNADGYGDIIVGAVGFPAGDPLLVAEEGAVFVFLGGPSGITARGPQGAQATFQGSELAEWIGQSVSTAGDVDRDGFDDILFGARVYPGSLASEGVAYVFRGGPGGVVGASLGSAHRRIVSNTAQAFLGSDVAGGIDVDGDLWPDMLVGVTGYSGGQLFEGAAFVFQGTPSVNPPNQLPIADAGADLTVVDTDGSGSETVVLDGSESFDVDGMLVGHVWTQGALVQGTNAIVSKTLAVGTHTIQLRVTDNSGASDTDLVVVTVQSAGGPGPDLLEGDVSLGGSTQVDRGDPVSWTITLTNTGSVPLTSVSLSLDVDSAQLVKDLTPGPTVSVGDVAVGASVSHTWTGQADKEGAGLVTASAFSRSTELGTTSQPLTVLK